MRWTVSDPENPAGWQQPIGNRFPALAVAPATLFDPILSHFEQRIFLLQGFDEFEIVVNEQFHQPDHFESILHLVLRPHAYHFCSLNQYLIGLARQFMTLST